MLSSSPASAHPSDFETLTVDLVFTSSGLHLVDGAVVESEGPAYDPFPTAQLRETVALAVLDAVGLNLADVSVDALSSERYHQVGFTIRLVESPSEDHTRINLNSQSLQVIAGSHGMKWLKLSICGQDEEVFGALVLESKTSSRQPNPQSQERRHCAVWRVGVEEEPIMVSAILPSLPRTGFETSPFVPIALLAVVVGFAAVVLGHGGSRE